MSGYPCSSCGQRVAGRIASAYVAWIKADGERIAYKLRLCFDCVRVNFTPLFTNMRKADPQSLSWCPVCEKETSPAELDPVYLTLYLPKDDPKEYAFQFHAACAARFRGPVASNGIRLADRGGRVRGPSPSESQDWGSVA